MLRAFPNGCQFPILHGGPGIFQISCSPPGLGVEMSFLPDKAVHGKQVIPLSSVGWECAEHLDEHQGILGRGMSKPGPNSALLRNPICPLR